MTESAITRPAFFHGWWIVIAGFVCTLLTIGSTTYAFGLFVEPLSKEFGLTRADINSGFIFLLLGFAVWAPIVGRLLDRLPARAVMSAGAALFAGGFVLVALAQSPIVMGLMILGPVSLGTVACGALAANTITSRWFEARRGRAMGLLAVSTSAGGFSMPPLIALLMENFGWRSALIVQGLMAAGLMVLMVLLFIRDRPSDLQQAVDGGEARSVLPTEQRRSEEKLWSFGSLLGAANFWLVACGAGILLAADQALLASMIPYGMDAGLSLQQASFLMSCLTFSAILGKLAIGVLADRVDKRLLFCAVAACNIAFLVVLLMGPGYVVMLIACSIIGLAIGGTYPLWMTITADCFGARSFGTVMGSMNLVVMPFSIIAIRFIGEVFDRTGSYQLAFITFLGTALVSSVLILAVRLPGKGREASRV
jgi:MFS family permease